MGIITCSRRERSLVVTRFCLGGSVPTSCPDTRGFTDKNRPGDDEDGDRGPHGQDGVENADVRRIRVFLEPVADVEHHVPGCADEVQKVGQNQQTGKLGGGWLLAQN